MSLIVSLIVLVWIWVLVWVCMQNRFIEIDKFGKPAFLAELCCVRVLNPKSRKSLLIEMVISKFFRFSTFFFFLQTSSEMDFMFIVFHFFHPKYSKINIQSIFLSPSPVQNYDPGAFSYRIRRRNSITPKYRYLITAADALYIRERRCAELLCTQIPVTNISKAVSHHPWYTIGLEKLWLGQMATSPDFTLLCIVCAERCIRSRSSFLELSKTANSP